MFTLKVWLARLRGQLWFRPTLWSLIATAAALLGTLANTYLPESRVPNIERDTLQNMLTIIASSMLTVTTFSLSILVGAFSSASNAATPRATGLMMEDDSAQSAIASFVAAFIYSIIALLALGIGYYGPSGRFVLLIGTVLMTGWVIVALLRWLQTLASLGRMGDTIQRVEHVASRAMVQHRTRPYLNAQRSPKDVHGWPVHGTGSGYVRHIDVDALQACAAETGGMCHIRIRPGGWTDPGVPLVVMEKACTDTRLRKRIIEAFHIGEERTFAQDPRFGMLVLGEIAQRALSPAVNDSGTAIAVLAAQARIFIQTASIEPDTATCSQVSLVALSERDLFDDAFGGLERDGAGSLELNIRLQKMLAAIARNGNDSTREAARSVAQRACTRSAEQLAPADRERLLRIFHEVWDLDLPKEE